MPRFKTINTSMHIHMKWGCVEDKCWIHVNFDREAQDSANHLLYESGFMNPNLALPKNTLLAEHDKSQVRKQS
jgi:hypothetical protein